MIDSLPVNIEWGNLLGVIKPLAIFVAGIVVYSLFIFKFYRFLAKMDIFELNLNKYNTTKHPELNKFFAGILYIVEYIIFFPLFLFFWFSVLAVLLAFLTRQADVQSTFLISMALVAAVRITSYYNEDLSKDLAKMLPFALLGIFLVDISYFSIEQSWALIKQMPAMWHNFPYYFGFVVVLEFVLRIGHGLVTSIIPSSKNRD